MMTSFASTTRILWALSFIQEHSQSMMGNRDVIIQKAHCTVDMLKERRMGKSALLSHETIKISCDIVAAMLEDKKISSLGNYIVFLSWKH